MPKSVLCQTDTKGIIGICHDVSSFTQAIEKGKRYGLSTVLVEEYLPIEYEVGMSGACVEGKMLGFGFFHKRSVCTGSRIGNTVSGEVIDASCDAGLVDFARHIGLLMREISYNGLFDVDMVYAKGKYYLIEINVRIGAFGFAVIAAGLDLVRLYINALNGQENNAREFQPNRYGMRALNEQVLLEELGEGRVSLLKYFREFRDAPVRKIRNISDPAPYKCFMRASWWAILSNLLGCAGPLLARVYHFAKKCRHE